MANPCGTYNESYAQDMAILRTRFQWLMAVAGIVFVACVPLIIPAGIVHALNMMLLTAVAALGLNILTGYCGQISIGHAAFILVGSEVAGVLVAKCGWNIFATLPAAALASGLVGVLFGLPSLRVKGLYLAVATLAAHYILVGFFFHFFTDIFGNGWGFEVPSAKIGNIVFKTPASIYWLFLPLVLVMTLFARNLVRSHWGRAFVAVRDNDLAAEVMGISLWRTKLYAFFIACVFAGVAGWMWVVLGHWVRADAWSIMDSIWYLGILIVGGLGTTVGPFLGTLVIRGLNELVTRGAPAISPVVGLLPFVATEAQAQIAVSLGWITFGVIVIVFLIYEPRGLAHTWSVLRERVRCWPFTYRYV